MSDDKPNLADFIVGQIKSVGIDSTIGDGDRAAVTLICSTSSEGPNKNGDAFGNDAAAQLKVAATFGERYGMGAKSFGALTGFDHGKLHGPRNNCHTIPKKDYAPGNAGFDTQIELMKMGTVKADMAVLASALGIPPDWLDESVSAMYSPPPVPAAYSAWTKSLPAAKDLASAMGLDLTAPATHYHVDLSGRVWVDGVLRPGLSPSGMGLGPVTMIDPIEIDMPRPIDIDTFRPMVTSMRPGHRGYRMPVPLHPATPAAKSQKPARPYRPTRDFFKHWDDEDSSDD